MYIFCQFYGTQYYNKWNVIFCLSVSCFKVMNKKWNEESISARLHDVILHISWERQNLLAKYCRRNQGWNGLPAIIEILKIGRCTRGGKGSEKDDSLAIPHGRPRGCDKRVAWFNNAARSSEAPVRRAGADNHYRTTCLCVFLYARVCLVHIVRSERTA